MLPIFSLQYMILSSSATQNKTKKKKKGTKGTSEKKKTKGQRRILLLLFSLHVKDMSVCGFQAIAAMQTKTVAFSSLVVNWTLF